MKERFNQPSFQAYMTMEWFLLKAIDGSCTKDKHDFLHENYHGDIEIDYLEAEKEVWKIIFRDFTYFPVFGLNMEIYGVNLRIHSKYRKIWTKKTPYLDTSVRHLRISWTWK